MDELAVMAALANYEHAAATAHTALFRAEQVIFEESQREAAAIEAARSSIAEAIRACDAILEQFQLNAHEKGAAA